jgi:tRNA threonylcarbamoyladenosine biosynthesis protein TsaE
MMKLSTWQQAHRLAAALAQLPKGSLILLTGPLGAGKTTLVQLVAKELGFAGRVNSPTYTLIHEYPTPQGLLIHADAYRLPSGLALEQWGLWDYLPEARLIFVEWGDPQSFPASLEIHLDPPPRRRATFWPHGSLGHELLKQLEAQLAHL